MKTVITCILPNPPVEQKIERDNRPASSYFRLHGVALGEKPHKVAITYGKQNTDLMLNTHTFCVMNKEKLQDGNHVVKVPVRLVPIKSSKEEFSNLYGCQLLRAPEEGDIVSAEGDENKVNAINAAFSVLSKEQD